MPQKFANVNRVEEDGHGPPFFIAQWDFLLHSPDSGYNEVNTGEEDQDEKCFTFHLICICLTSFFSPDHWRVLFLIN